MGCNLSALRGKRMSIHPEMSNQIDQLKINDEFQTATFGVPCFWTPESQLGVVPGVLRTRVGFAGEGCNSMEAVEVDYDPTLISFPILVNHFLSLNCTKSKTTLVFYRSDQDRRDVEDALKGRWEKVKIIPYTGFYRASHSHQKYILQQFPQILKSLDMSQSEILHSYLATKLNGFLGGHGSRPLFDEELPKLGLSSDLAKMVERHVVWK